MNSNLETRTLVALAVFLSLLLIGFGVAAIWLPRVAVELVWLGSFSLACGLGLMLSLVVIVRRHNKNSEVAARVFSPAIGAGGFGPRFTAAMEKVNNLNREISDAVVSLSQQRQEAQHVRAAEQSREKLAASDEQRARLSGKNDPTLH